MLGFDWFVASKKKEDPPTGRRYSNSSSRLQNHHGGGSSRSRSNNNGYGGGGNSRSRDSRRRGRGGGGGTSALSPRSGFESETFDGGGDDDHGPFSPRSGFSTIYESSTVYTEDGPPFNEIYLSQSQDDDDDDDDDDDRTRVSQLVAADLNVCAAGAGDVVLDAVMDHLPRHLRPRMKRILPKLKASAAAKSRASSQSNSTVNPAPSVGGGGGGGGGNTTDAESSSNVQMDDELLGAVFKALASNSALKDQPVMAHVVDGLKMTTAGKDDSGGEGKDDEAGQLYAAIQSSLAKHQQQQQQQQQVQQPAKGSNQSVDPEVEKRQPSPPMSPRRPELREPESRSPIPPISPIPPSKPPIVASNDDNDNNNRGTLASPAPIPIIQGKEVDKGVDKSKAVTVVVAAAAKPPETGSVSSVSLTDYDSIRSRIMRGAERFSAEWSKKDDPPEKRISSPIAVSGNNIRTSRKQKEPSGDDSMTDPYATPPRPDQSPITEKKDVYSPTRSTKQQRTSTKSEKPRPAESSTNKSPEVKEKPDGAKPTADNARRNRIRPRPDRLVTLVDDNVHSSQTTTDAEANTKPPRPPSHNRKFRRRPDKSPSPRKRGSKRRTSVIQPPFNYCNSHFDDLSSDSINDLAGIPQTGCSFESHFGKKRRSERRRSPTRKKVPPILSPCGGGGVDSKETSPTNRSLNSGRTAPVSNIASSPVPSPDSGATPPISNQNNADSAWMPSMFNFSFFGSTPNVAPKNNNVQFRAKPIPKVKVKPNPNAKAFAEFDKLMAQRRWQSGEPIEVEPTILRHSRPKQFTQSLKKPCGIRLQGYESAPGYHSSDGVQCTYPGLQQVSAFFGGEHIDESRSWKRSSEDSGTSGSRTRHYFPQNMGTETFHEAIPEVEGNFSTQPNGFSQRHSQSFQDAFQPTGYGVEDVPGYASPGSKKRAEAVEVIHLEDEFDTINLDRYGNQQGVVFAVDRVNPNRDSGAEDEGTRSDNASSSFSDDRTYSSVTFSQPRKNKGHIISSHNQKETIESNARAGLLEARRQHIRNSSILDDGDTSGWETTESHLDNSLAATSSGWSESSRDEIVMSESKPWRGVGHLKTPPSPLKPGDQSVDTAYLVEDGNHCVTMADALSGTTDESSKGTFGSQSSISRARDFPMRRTVSGVSNPSMGIAPNTFPTPDLRNQHHHSDAVYEQINFNANAFLTPDLRNQHHRSDAVYEQINFNAGPASILRRRPNKPPKPEKRKSRDCSPEKRPEDDVIPGCLSSEIVEVLSGECMQADPPTIDPPADGQRKIPCGSAVFGLEQNQTEKELSEKKFLLNNRVRHEVQQPIPNSRGAWVGDPIPVYENEVASQHQGQHPSRAHNRVHFHEDWKGSSKPEPPSESNSVFGQSTSLNFRLGQRAPNNTINDHSAIDSENSPAKAREQTIGAQELLKNATRASSIIGEPPPQGTTSNPILIDETGFGAGEPSVFRASASETVSNVALPTAINGREQMLGHNNRRASIGPEQTKDNFTEFSDEDLSIEPISSQDHPFRAWGPMDIDKQRAQPFLSKERDYDTSFSSSVDVRQNQKQPTGASQIQRTISREKNAHPENDLIDIIDKGIKGLDIPRGDGVLLIKPNINIFNGPAYGANALTNPADPVVKPTADEVKSPVLKFKMAEEAGPRPKESPKLKEESRTTADKQRKDSNKAPDYEPEIIHLEEMLSFDSYMPQYDTGNQDIQEYEQDPAVSVVSLQQQVDDINSVLSVALQDSSVQFQSASIQEEEDGSDEDEDDDGMREELQRLETSEQLLREQLESAQKQLALQEQLLKKSLGKGSASDKPPEEKKMKKFAPKEMPKMYNEGRKDPVLHKTPPSSPQNLQDNELVKKAELGVPMALTDFDDYFAPRTEPALFPCCGAQLAYLNSVVGGYKKTGGTGYDDITNPKDEDDGSSYDSDFPDIVHARIEKVLRSSDTLELSLYSESNSTIHTTEEEDPENPGVLIMHHQHHEAVEMMFIRELEVNDEDSEEIEIVFVEESFLSTDSFSYGETKGIVFDWIRMGEDGPQAHKVARRSNSPKKSSPKKTNKKPRNSSPKRTGKGGRTSPNSRKYKNSPSPNNPARYLQANQKSSPAKTQAKMIGSKDTKRKSPKKSSPTRKIVTVKSSTAHEQSQRPPRPSFSPPKAPEIISLVDVDIDADIAYDAMRANRPLSPHHIIANQMVFDSLREQHQRTKLEPGQWLLDSLREQHQRTKLEPSQSFPSASDPPGTSAYEIKLLSNGENDAKAYSYDAGYAATAQSYDQDNNLLYELESVECVSQPSHSVSKSLRLLEIQSYSVSTAEEIEPRHWIDSSQSSQDALQKKVTEIMVPVEPSCSSATNYKEENKPDPTSSKSFLSLSSSDDDGSSSYQQGGGTYENSILQDRSSTTTKSKIEPVGADEHLQDLLKRGKLLIQGIGRAHTTESESSPSHNQHSSSLETTSNWDSSEDKKKSPPAVVTVNHTPGSGKPPIVKKKKEDKLKERKATSSAKKKKKKKKSYKASALQVQTSDYQEKKVSIGRNHNQSQAISSEEQASTSSDSAADIVNRISSLYAKTNGYNSVSSLSGSDSFAIGSTRPKQATKLKNSVANVVSIAVPKNNDAPQDNDKNGAPSTGSKPEPGGFLRREIAYRSYQESKPRVATSVSKDDSIAQPSPVPVSPRVSPIALKARLFQRQLKGQRDATEFPAKLPFDSYRGEPNSSPMASQNSPRSVNKPNKSTAWTIPAASHQTPSPLNSSLSGKKPNNKSKAWTIPVDSHQTSSPLSLPKSPRSGIKPKKSTAWTIPAANHRTLATGRSTPPSGLAAPSPVGSAKEALPSASHQNPAKGKLSVSSRIRRRFSKLTSLATDKRRLKTTSPAKAKTDLSSSTGKSDSSDPVSFPDIIPGNAGKSASSDSVSFPDIIPGKKPETACSGGNKKEAMVFRQPSNAPFPDLIHPACLDLTTPKLAQPPTTTARAGKGLIQSLPNHAVARTATSGLPGSLLWKAASWDE